MNRKGASAAGLLCTLLFVAPTQGAAEPHLWDEAGALSARVRADLERRLTTAGRRLRSPVFVVVIARLAHETAAGMADRVFAERALGGDPKSNPVLLLISIRERVSAVATGKGNAGIVPEMDAGRIQRRLSAGQARGALGAAVARAIDEIVVSAEATAARRQPLVVPDEDLPPPDSVTPPPPPPSRETSPDNTVASGTSALGSTDGGITQGTGARPASDAGSRKSSGRSQIPVAVAVGVLVLLALALRRRHQIAATRGTQAPDARPRPKSEQPQSGRPPRRPGR
jgi:hypothetical protein